MAITFHNEQTPFMIKGRREVARWIRATVEKEGFSVGEIAVIFTSDDYLLDMNRKYLGHDYPTDIITFDYWDVFEPKALSGDLFISVAAVEANARDFDAKMGDELLRVIIHGVLHLCGHKDESGTERKAMRAREEHYLSLFTGNLDCGEL